MKNIDKVSSALSKWIMKIASSVMPKVSVPTDSNIGKVMSGFFGVDVSRYNVWDELGFLLQPTVDSFVKPLLEKYLTMIPDEKIPEVIENYTKSFISKIQKDNYVNIFGIQLGGNVFEDLSQIINEELSHEI